MTREQLKAVYEDWINNFASVASFAEHYGLYVDEAYTLIELARSCYDRPHPEN